MKRAPEWNWIAQCFVVLLCAYSLKLFYSKAGANELRWILAPTAGAVELVTGSSFEFESNAGYLSGDRHFLIAPSCAGVNFLITAFLMLSARRLLDNRFRRVGWGFIPSAALAGYFVTLVANATRIALALRLEQTPGFTGGLSQNQIHRLEGVVVYFLFLVLLFVVSERPGPDGTAFRSRRTLIPLSVYYATMLGIPLANGAYRREADFWGYSLFVAITPLALILSIAAFRFFRQRLRLKLHLIPRQPFPPAAH